MPNVNGFYQAPTWENDNAPAIDATELQAMCNLLESLDANALTYRSLLTADDNVDTISVTGIYYINSNATPQGTLPTTFSAPARLLHIGTSGIQIQVLFDKNNTVNYRVKSSGNFGAWEYIPDVDTTLTVSGAAADAKTVGDLAIMADKIYNTAEAFDAAFQGDYNNLTPNKIITIGASAVGGENAPYTGFVGKVFTICRKTTSTRPQPGDVQLAISNGRNLYIRYLNPSGWTEWMRFVNDTRLQDNAVTRYSQMILNASQLSTVTGGTLSADDLPANSIVCIGANAANLGGINFPVIGGAQTYTILTVGSDSLPNKGGNAQIAVGANGCACRWRTGSAWGDWLYSASTTELTTLRNEAVTRYYPMITDAEKLSEATGGTLSADDLPVNSIVCMGVQPSSLGGINFPVIRGNGASTILTINCSTTTNSDGEAQIAVSQRGTACRWKVAGSWRDWFYSASTTELQDNAVTRYSQMILNASQLSTVTGGTLSADDLPANSIVCIGANASGLGGINFPVIDGSQTYTILTVGSNSLPNKGGNAQIAVGANGFASRWRSGSAWGDWLCSTAQAPEYHVGAGQPYTSLTALCQALANDTREKIIYLHPGVYNIYQEYRDAGIPTPPDDVTSGDYLDRCVFLPPNTKLIGIGNVTLQWTPAKAEITRGEARTWSPLNIKYGCHVENIDIVCQYGRYCIHDDSHNAAADQGVSHVFRNVRCFYTYAEDGHGFNNTIGFGFSQKNRYLFDNCTFAFTGAPAGSGTAFYGHGSSSGSEDESPEITVNHCIIIDDAENGRAIRLQNLGSSQLHIKTQFCSCHIDGRVILTDYTSTAKQGFELTLLRSGDHTVEYAGTTNPFPPKIYN